MKKIIIADKTMRQSGKGVDFSLSFREKLELVKLLDKLGTDVIEMSPIANPKIDSLLIKSVSSAVKESVVAVSVGLEEENIDLAWRALGEAKHPRLQVKAPVSAVQMEYIAGLKPDAMLKRIDTLLRHCRALCGDVELIASDATRSDAAFLYKVIDTAVEAGVSTVTLCDTAGNLLPDEFAAFLEATYAGAPRLREVTLGVGCSNELAMADACAVAAIRCGAGEIKAAAYDVNSVSLENIGRLLSAKGGDFGVSCTLRATQLRRTLEQIRRLCSAGRADDALYSGGGSAAEGLYLTAHDDLSAVMKVVAQLGYELSEEDGAKVYEAFSRIAARKETVGARELEAIVATAAMQVPPTYRLETYVINTGNTISATAHLKLQKAGVMKEGLGLGDGPIDAAFRAIEQIVGHHYELDDFQIQSVTEGREAMGEAVVKLRSGGKLYAGRGISTDIVGSSIHAYLSALNKIVYEENSI